MSVLASVKYTDNSILIDNTLQMPQHLPDCNQSTKMPINQVWFQEKLRERKISQRRLAKLIDLDPAAISNLFAGKRRMTPQEAQQIASHLLVPVTEVLRQAGIDVQDDVRKIPIAGYITGQSTVITLAPGAEDYMVAPPDIPADSYALQARTQMTSAAYADGWLFLITPTRIHPETLYGKLCLSGVKSGELYIGIVSRGYKSNHHNVSLLLNGQTLENLDVIWCSPVLWIKPN